MSAHPSPCGGQPADGCPYRDRQLFWRGPRVGSLSNSRPQKQRASHATFQNREGLISADL